MAIARGAGTEIIRSHCFEAVNDTEAKLIMGVQHHIYTILSVTCYCNARNGTENGYLRIMGYDSYAGETNNQILISSISASAGETFVWNDKFSFNGCEPTNFTGPMDDATKQNAIADQGEDTKPQKLQIVTEDAQDAAHIHITYIDQNNE